MKLHANPQAAWLLLAVLAAGNADAQQSHEAAQAAKAAQEQRDGAPQAQEEQAGNAAQQPQRKPGEQPVKGQPQGRPPSSPQHPAPRQDGKQPPPKRRAVPAIIGSMPAPTPPQAYGPVLHPAAPQTPMPAPAPGGLPPPAPLNTCIGNQCTDASGNSYQTGVGNAALDSKGRLCNRNGTTMQCF